MIEFENAHCHSMLSNILTCADSTMTAEDYAKVYSQRGMQCLCLSEHGNRSDVWLQADVAAKYTSAGYNMKPICAAEAYFVPDRNPELQDKRNFHLLLIAKNNEGFEELNMALSEANETGYYMHARVDFDILQKLNPKNFLVTTACVGGILKDPDGEVYAHKLHDIFQDNFRLEVQWHLNNTQKMHNEKVLSLYKKYHWPLFFATDSHYINHEDAILRQELQASSKIHMDDTEWDLYLPTAEEAYKAMLQQGVLTKAQIEEAFENTLELRTFEGFSYDTTRKFPIAIDKLALSQEERNNVYKQLVFDGYNECFGQPTEDELKEIAREMKTVIDTGSADYFIGTHDLIQKGIENGGILTTTSRGSACGFVTNAALKLTTINRLHAPVPIYPERFVTPDKLKVSMPDIDSNISNVEAFEQAGREIFGEYGCLPMIAYGNTKVLSAFKMLCRVRDIDAETANNISKQIMNYELDCKHAIENNQDDEDYNVNDDIKIESYVEEQYIDLIKESANYQNIIVNVSPHPCGHIIYHEDLRRKVGVISLKPKTGEKNRTLCAYINGTMADQAGYCKIDLLRVTVVKLIYETFKSIHQDRLTADELIKRIENDPRVWDLYAKGYTQALNQCEGPKTTERCKTFKPKNIVELCAFVAAIRPGAKSLVDDFVSRTPHTYGIPAMDKLLRLNGATGVTGESSYLFYDENVLQLGQAAGIEPADAYMLLKAIKKKKAAKVKSYKDKFIPGFIKHLITSEGTEQELAEQTAEAVWQTIIDSASYLFNCSHSYAVALDSLYGAYLKANYPFEFYAEVLKDCAAKKNIKKIALVVDEMKHYKGIRLTTGRFGQDNRDWYIDKENNTISQSLVSIKGISSKVADFLYQIKNMEFDTFTEFLFYLLKNSPLTSAHKETLIKLNYFEKFGKRQKLLNIMSRFDDGPHRITKSLSQKGIDKRIPILISDEILEDDIDIPTVDAIASEYESIGMCITSIPQLKKDVFFIKDIDDRYTVKLDMFNVKTGGSGTVLMKKADYTKHTPQKGTCICITGYERKNKYIKQGEKFVPSPDGEKLFYITEFEENKDA